MWHNIKELIGKGLDIEVLYNIATEVKSNDNEIKTDFQDEVLEWWKLTFLETFFRNFFRRV